MPDTGVYQMLFGFSNCLPRGCSPVEVWVEYAQHQLILAVFQVIRNVEAKGIGTTRVRTYQPTVYPKTAFVINGTKMQQYPLAGPVGRQANGPAVPQPLIGSSDLLTFDTVDSTQNGTRICPSYLVGSGCRFGRNGVIPHAIQILPLLPYQLRTGVFAPGIFGRKLFFPAAHDRSGLELANGRRLGYQKLRTE